jgi:ribosomal protein S16
MVKIEPDEISSIIQQIAQYSEEVKSLLLEQYFK